MGSHPKLIELRPDRSLLNSNFDGYKLILSNIPIISQQLQIPVDRLVPDVNQYSLLHAKLYALHNHLIGESDTPDIIYFIDKELNVQKLTVEVSTHQFSNVAVWKVPQKNRVPGDYNISMKFATDKIAVIGDGAGLLYVLDRTGEKWEMIFCGDVIGSDQKFVVTDAVYKETQKPELHVLLTSIRQKEPSERHSTVLNWITLEKSDSWNQVALRELTIKGFVQYANFERSCDAVYVVSDAGCKFTLDSENEIRENVAVEVDKEYKWTQGRDDVTLTFPFSDTIDKHLINVETESTHIRVKYENIVLLEGELYQRIDPDVTCWTVQGTNLEIVIQKVEAGIMWPEVVEGDRLGEYVADPALIAEVTERLAPLTSDVEVAPSSGSLFNSQQVEECDFESDKLTIFERVCGNSHKVTHKVNLGSHPVLLTVDVDKELPSALGVRSDVDTCIWVPQNTGNDFSLEHKGTLLALGYIQASKQQMKFFVCSPDLTYSVICEATRHIFIYCQNRSIGATELRNRATGQRVRTMAQQEVYCLPSNDEILGIYASNSYLYVLAENFIIALKL